MYESWEQVKCSKSKGKHIIAYLSSAYQRRWSKSRYGWGGIGRGRGIEQ